MYHLVRKHHTLRCAMPQKVRYDIPISAVSQKVKQNWLLLSSFTHFAQLHTIFYKSLLLAENRSLHCWHREIKTQKVLTAQNSTNPTTPLCGLLLVLLVRIRSFCFFVFALRWVCKGLFCCFLSWKLARATPTRALEPGSSCCCWWNSLYISMTSG